MLAPIGISTYIRLLHLQQTISALQKNTLAEESELFVFSDAPRSGDERKVEEIRSYLRTLNGFKAIHIVERKTNNRVKNNRDGLRMLLDQFGKVIFLEEDILTAPAFLTFMNQALDKYETNKKVFSVTGYCPPILIPPDYKYDMFFLIRFSGWGFGIWKDRFEQIKYISPEEYEGFAKNKKLVRLFGMAGGHDMTAMLKADAYGKIDALDVKAMYTQFLTDQYTVYPSKSLTINNGMDGTGVHCGNTDRFEVELSDKKSFSFPGSIIVDPRILKANLIFNLGPIYGQKLEAKARGLARKLLEFIKNYTN